MGGGGQNSITAITSTGRRVLQDADEPLMGGRYSTIGGGLNNKVDAEASVVGGGISNKIKRKAKNSVIVGGTRNVIKRKFGVIGGGRKNVVKKSYGVITGGKSNKVTGIGGLIPGGERNFVKKDYGIAMGRKAIARKKNSFSINLFPKGRSRTGENGELRIKAVEFRFEIARFRTVIRPDNASNLINVLNGVSPTDRRVLAREEDSMTAEHLKAQIEMKEGIQASNDISIEELTEELTKLEEQVEFVEEIMDSNNDEEFSDRLLISNDGNRKLLKNFDVESYGASLEDKILSQRSLQDTDTTASKGTNSVIGGGKDNTAGGDEATVNGGLNNKASGLQSTIGGGRENRASGILSAVGGGSKNKATDTASTVGGGQKNVAKSSGAYIGGGQRNKAEATTCAIGGGDKNSCSTKATGAFIGGGKNNKAKGEFSTIGGGSKNRALGEGSAVMGGFKNDARGKFSIAVGRRAIARENHSFAGNFRNVGNARAVKKSIFFIKAKVVNFCIQDKCATIDKTNAKKFRDLLRGTLTEDSSDRRRASFVDLDDDEEEDMTEEERELLELRNQHEIITEVLRAQAEEIEDLRSEIELERTKLAALLR